MFTEPAIEHPTKLKCDNKLAGKQLVDILLDWQLVAWLPKIVFAFGGRDHLRDACVPAVVFNKGRNWV